MKPLRIAQIAPFEETVPPLKYGGTELVVANLANELVALGHRVTLFAAGGSRTAAQLIRVVNKPIRHDQKISSEPARREAMKFMSIALLLEAIRREKFDIIHNHLGWRLLPFARFLPGRVITTLHKPLDVEYEQAVYQQYRDLPYITISDSQRRPLPGLNYVGTVYNGIAVEKFTASFKPAKYLAFLGRMSPEKGPLQAIMAAKKAKMPLVMAAKVDVVDQSYFKQKIKPLINGRSIRFIGEVDHAGKVKLLKNAAALLALIQWEEPFGLFMIEALSCGTPVIATNRGSVPELIQNGVTGFITKNEHGAVEAIKKINQINRRECRRVAEERFSSRQMATEYLKLYQKVL